MRLAAGTAVLLASLLSLLFPSIQAAAAPGDLLETSRTNVNVRAEPTTEAAIVARINPGERIIEIDRTDEWYHVSLPDRSSRGWIFGPLINAFSEPNRAAANSAPTSTAPAPAQPSTARSTTTAAAFDSSLIGNPVRGETVFFKCGSCHTTVPGVHAQGPSLVGIFGRPPAQAPGFGYSGALQSFARNGAVWDAATLDRFIQRPGRVVKGTSMPFSGLRDPQDRRDVIAFLQQLSR